MQVLAIDDEKIALEGLTDLIKKALPDAEVYSYRNALKAVEELEGKHIDIAFLDIEMRDINGLQFADHLKERFPKINVIFTTGYSEYVGEAMDLHASGYIMKPVTLEKIKKEIGDLRYPVEDAVKKKDVLRVQTFGNFEVFKNNDVLHFQYNKNKSNHILPNLDFFRMPLLQNLPLHRTISIAHPEDPWEFHRRKGIAT